MVGNTANRIFDDFREGKNTLIDCFQGYPETYKMFLGLFTRLTNIDTLLCSSGEKTLEQREQTADALKEFGRYFLMLKAFKNMQKTDSSLLQTKHPKHKSNKKLF